MRNGYAAFFVSSLAILTLAAALEADEPARSYGPVSKGLQISLTADRDSLCPGEFLNLQAVFRNASAEPFALPREPVWPGRELRIKSDAGDVFMRKHPEGALRPADDLEQFPPGAKQTIRTMSLRFISGTSGWFSAATGEPAEAPLGRAGKWQIWCEYEVPKLTSPAGDVIWSGKAVSNTVLVDVHEPDPQVFVRDARPDQIEDLKTFVTGKAKDIRAIEARLEADLLRVENDGLARRAAETLKRWVSDGAQGDVARSKDIYDMLTGRAVYGRYPQPPLPAIDGPYLRTFAEATLGLLDRPPEPAWRGLPRPEVVVAYLKFHPEDKGIRDRLLASARRAASVAQYAYGLGDPPPPPCQHGWQGPEPAWRVLIDLAVLHAGMTLAEVSESLGPPTDSHADSVGWYVSSPMHVNPYLRATVNQGRITAFEITRR